MPETYLITRCPSCSTAFRASESQLSARSGQVRCGRCEAVFDAFAHEMPGDERTSESEKTTAPPLHPHRVPSHHADSQAGGPDSRVEATEPELLVLTPAPSEALPHEIEPETPPAVH